MVGCQGKTLELLYFHRSWDHIDEAVPFWYVSIDWSMQQGMYICRRKKKCWAYDMVACKMQAWVKWYIKILVIFSQYQMHKVQQTKDKHLFDNYVYKNFLPGYIVENVELWKSTVNSSNVSWAVKTSKYDFLVFEVWQLVLCLGNNTYSQVWSSLVDHILWSVIFIGKCLHYNRI